MGLLLPDTADTLLRLRALLAVLFAVFVAPLTLWLRYVGLLLRELADFVLVPLDLALLDVAPVLPVVDLIPADLALLDILAILPDVLFLLAVFIALPPAVLMEADEVERLFFIFMFMFMFIPSRSLSPFPLIVRMAAPSLPNLLAV